MFFLQTPSISLWKQFGQKRSFLDSESCCLALACFFVLMLLLFLVFCTRGYFWLVEVHVCRSKVEMEQCLVQVCLLLVCVHLFCVCRRLERVYVFHCVSVVACSLWCCCFEVLRGWWKFMCAASEVEMEQCWLKFICTSACFFVMFCFRVFTWLVGVYVCRSKSWDGTVLSRSLVGEHKDSALHPSITSSSNNKQNNNTRQQ